MKTILSVCILAAFLFSPLLAQQSKDDWIVFESKKFERTTGSPNKYTETISLPIQGEIPFTLYIENGESVRKQNRVSSASVKVNNKTIFSSSDFNQNVGHLEREVKLYGDNKIEITVEGKPGCYIAVKCLRHLMPVYPKVDCVQKNTDGSYTAHFGYQNDNNYDVIAPIGLLNLFIPLPIDRGQPTVFKPGRQKDVFTVVFNGRPLIWEVRGRITIANSSSLACSSSDTTDPSLSMTSPIEGTITSGSSILITGSVSDVSTVSVTVNGIAATVTNGTFNATVNLIEGINTIVVTATDAFGNSTTIERHVTRDSQSPIINLTSPIDSLITKLQSITVSGTVTDSTTVSLTINGTIVQIESNGAFSTQVALTEGSNTISVVATDAAANQSTMTRQVTVDTQVPTLIITSPLDSTFTNLSLATVSGSVTESHLASFSIAGTPVPVNPDGSYSMQVNLNEGPNTISIVATDKAGNSTTKSELIIRDSQSPVINLTSPIDSLITKQQIVNVSGTVTDSTAVTLTINGSSAPVGVGGVFSYQLSMAEGMNTITIVATDAAGNTKTDSILVIRDSQSPVINLTSPTDSLITKLESITVSGTAVDEHFVSLKINDVPVTLDSTGAYSISLNLNEGTNTISIVAADKAGNITTVTRIAIRDTQSPIVNLTSPIDSLLTNQLNVTVGGTIVDLTAVTLTINESSVPVAVSGVFSYQLSLAEGMNTITIVATDAAGNTKTDSILVIRDSQSPVINLTSPTDSLITKLESITVSGTVTDEHFASLKINDTSIDIDSAGAFSVSLSLIEGVNTISIVATDKTGNEKRESVNVRRDSQPPIVNLTSPVNNFITKLPSVTISGTISDSTTVSLTINGLALVINPDGSFSHDYSLNEGRNIFNIVATDVVGNNSTISKLVIRDSQPPVLNIISPTNNVQTTDSVIAVLGSVGDSTNISLTMNGVGQSLSADGGFNTSIFLTYGGNTITVIASDQVNNATVSTRIVTRVPLPPDPVTIAPPVDTTVSTLVMDATEFLYTGADPIQKGVAPGTINKIQVTALRGRVLDKELQPLPGAKVTILGKPELGYTFSREDGMYDIVVNGGGEVKVNFEKVGYLPAQRQVTARWASYASVDDAVMMKLDTTIHLVDFKQPEVVQGSPATDVLGIRRPTLFFNQGTQAKLVFRTYSYRTIQGCVQIFQGIPYPESPITITTPVDSLVEAKSINVRATEYTVGTNGEIDMPAKLPETVAYTFAFELTADEMLSAGAIDVRFNQPVSLYLENIMNFPVGLTVPMGCYNREKGFWETSDNGRVIKILSTSGGIAAIDYNGDGVADPADTLVIKGILLIEQQYLASTYSAGQSIWRAEITHLGTYAGGFGMIAPNAKDPQNPLPDRYAKVDRDNIVAGSVIGVQNQTLGESIPITNTPMTMSYKSDRVFGRREAYCLDIPLTGKTLPDSMSKVTLEVEIVGNTYTYEFAPQPNLTYHFEWDGKDAYGRRVQGQQNILTTIGYRYHAQYALPPDLRRCFATPSGQIIEQYVPTRMEVKRTQIWEGKIGAFDMLPLGIGGWSLSLHHGYDCVGRILYKGTGDVRSANVMDNVINTIAGLPNDRINNKCYPSEWVDGKIAVQTKIGAPTDLQSTSDGSLYYRDNVGTIVRIDAAGRMSTIAGKHGGCSTGLPDTATNIAANCGNFFGASTGMTQGPDKSLYLSTDKNVIWRITPDGEIIRFAGIPYDAGSFGGGHKFGGDGGPALNAYLGWPWALASGKDGCLYIADRYNCRIRKISPDGIITTVAGTGVKGSTGDGGPAVLCTLNDPYGLRVAPDGSILFCDAGNQRVRKITPDGIVRPFAGNGDLNYANTGDGGPALQARLWFPNDISIANDGTVFIVSRDKIRGVATDGYIKTVVGGGNTFWLENGPATSAHLGYNWTQIAFGPDRNLYVSEWPWPYAPSNLQGPRIFKVTPPLPGITLSEILIASEDGSERYVFTYSGRHLRTLDALTGVVKYSFGYDSNYKLITITDVDSLVTHIERDTTGIATAIISPYGVRTQLYLDSLGYLLQAINPASESRQFTYTDSGLMTSMTDARSNTYHYEYDSLGYLTRDLDPVGGYTNLARTYDTLGYTITAITAMGKTTKYRSEKSPDGTRRFINIDPNGLKTIIVDSTDGSSYTITPEGMNRPATEKPDPRFGMQSPLVNATAKTPGGLQSNVNQFRAITQMTGTAVTGLQDSISVNGKAFKTNYDGNARMLTKTSAEGRKTFSFFDTKGRIVKDSIPGILATTHKYDNKGRKIEVNQGGRKTAFAYDSLGRQARVTDPSGRSTKFFYNAGDRLVKTILPDSSEILFTYDNNGNLLSLTPPSKPEHSFEYSTIDLETRYTPPYAPTGQAGDSARATARTYTLDKELWRILRPDSLNITLEYGGKSSLAGQPKKIYFDRGTIVNLFDTTKAQQIGVVAPTGDSLKLVYDGTLIKKVIWSGQNGTNSVKGNVAFAYNSDQQVTTEMVISATGAADSVSLKYDKDGLLTSIGAIKLRFGANNILLLSDTVGSIITNYTYDSFGVLVSKEVKSGATILYRIDFTRDILSRIIQKIENEQGNIAKYDYSYDIVGQLSKVYKNDTLISNYSYDTNGNRLGHWTSGIVDSGSYDAQDRLHIYSSTKYSYTQNGDLSIKTDTIIHDDTHYSYDAFGSLRTVTLPNGTLIEYLIDASGKRVGRKKNGVVTQKWLYSTDLHIIAELDSENNIVSRFVYTTSENVPEYFVKADIIYRIVTDQLGSVKQIVNTQTGTIIQQIDYDEYGNVLVDSNPGITPFGFAGGLYDSQTKLLRFGARDYCSSIGRWTTADKARLKGSQTNFHIYCLNDPINNFDPSGLSAESISRLMISGFATVAAFGEFVKSTAECLGGRAENVTVSMTKACASLLAAEIGMISALDALNDTYYPTNERSDILGYALKNLGLPNAAITSIKVTVYAISLRYSALITGGSMASKSAELTQMGQDLLNIGKQLVKSTMQIILFYSAEGQFLMR